MVAVYEKGSLIFNLTKLQKRNDRLCCFTIVNFLVEMFISNPFIEISYVEIVQLSKRTGWVLGLSDVRYYSADRLRPFYRNSEATFFSSRFQFFLQFFQQI